MNINPKIRAETALDLFSKIDGAIRHELENSIFPFQNCLNCMNFNEQNEICKLVNDRPPAKIICYGCEKHEDIQEIPF